MSDPHKPSAAILLGALLLVALVFLPAPGAYFVADDHPVILRTAGAPAATMLSWFTAARYGWYRPLFDVYIAACGRLFGLNPIGYHLTNIALFALASALVGITAWLISKDRRVAAGASLLFILQSCHSEAVMWISAANELLAGVLALSSIATYIQYRRAGRLRWLLLTALTCTLAFMSKETSLFLPMMFVVTDVLFYRYFTGRPLKLLTFLPIVPFVLLAAVAAALRMSSASYSVSYHPLQLARNGVYYLLMELVAFPVTTTDLSAPVSYIPVLLAAFALAVMGAVLAVTRGRRAEGQSILPALIFAVSFALLALTPVIPIVSERTTFLSSTGVAPALALLGITLWDRLLLHDSRLAKLLILAAVLYLGANTFVLLNRNHYWRLARSESKSVITQLGEHVTHLPSGTEVWLIGLPDQIGHAYAFRNAFPDAAVLAGYRPIVYSVLDVDLEKLSGPEKTELGARVAARPHAQMLWYRNGALVAERP